jgi:hypothetical protein
MKQLSFFFLCLLAFKKEQAQNIKSSKASKDDLVYIINNIKLLDKKVSIKSDLYIYLYEVTNPSGSAYFEPCDDSSNLYIEVSEDSEASKHHLFKIKYLIHPKLIKWPDSPNDNDLYLSYSDQSDKKKTFKVKGEISKIEIKLLK